MNPSTRPAVPILNVTIIGGEFECNYCGLGFVKGRLCQSSGRGYCDQSCLSAYILQSTRPHLEERLEHYKKCSTWELNPTEEKDMACIVSKKYCKLAYLFFRGLLARQKKEQLLLLHETITEYSKEVFLIADEHRDRIDDAQLLYFADCCNDKDTLYRTAMIKAWGK
jgi:hypothetical protein